MKKKNQLLEKYREYANSDEAKAVLFVKKHLKQSSNCWIDIIDYNRFNCDRDDELWFRRVLCGLYVRKLKPQYLPKKDFNFDGKFNEHEYYLSCRAITWETAHKDIENQKEKGVIAKKYQIDGVRYNKNHGKYSRQPFWLNPESVYYGRSPESFDRRSIRPYELAPEWVYEIKSIKKVK